MKASTLSQFLHTRNFAALLIVVSIIGALAAYSGGNVLPLPADKGLALPSPNRWITSPGLSLAISLALNLFVAMLTVYINRAYNVLRNMSMLFAGLFFVMQAATPSLVCQFYGGIVVCTVLVVSSLMLFSIYGNPDSTRRVFLIFFFVSLAALFQYALLFYIPLLLLGCAQMRVLNLRSFLAAIVGCVTPVWILVGFGVIALDDFRSPDFISYFSMMTAREIMPIAVAVAVTMLIGVLFTLLNLMKILSYNSRNRAYNGFIALMLFMTAALVVVDFVDIAVYLPLLNCCAAFQVGHFFILHKGKHSYIGTLLILLIYVALYSWDLIS